MEIVVIGLNHRTAPIELRERMAFNAEDAERAMAQLRERGAVEEVVVLSTCNRSELYGVRPNPSCGSDPLEGFFADFHHVSREQMNGCLYSLLDREAIQHLFRVAAGLDSMLLGETEIMGQVREAYRRASESGATGPVLNRLFQSAVEVGRRVRSETELGTRPMSAASAGVKLAERVFGDLSAHSALVVGAGEVAQQAVEQLRQRKIKWLWISSRRRERAMAVAQANHAETIAWEELPRTLSRPDILVSSVSADEAVITVPMLERAMAERDNRSMLILDLGVPRNVDPDAARLYNLYLYHLDDLTEIVDQNRRAREREIPRAEAIVAAQISKFEAWRAGRSAVDLVDDLRSRLDARRRRILDAHAAAFAHLGPEDRLEIDRLTAQLVDELLEEPADRLRHARTWRERVQHIESLRGLFGLDSEDKS